MKPRSQLWWYLRFRKAYKLYGAKCSRRRTWKDAKIAQRSMPAAEQWRLKPLRGPS